MLKRQMRGYFLQTRQQLRVRGIQVRRRRSRAMDAGASSSRLPCRSIWKFSFGHLDAVGMERPFADVLAFAKAELCRFTGPVFVQRFDLSSTRWQISTSCPFSPRTSFMKRAMNFAMAICNLHLPAPARGAPARRTVILPVRLAPALRWVKAGGGHGA
jgi:hypothetical protein